jgi:hypothetical protein
MAIGYILWSSGIFFPVLECGKNLATLDTAIIWIWLGRNKRHLSPNFDQFVCLRMKPCVSSKGMCLSAGLPDFS